MNFCISTHTVLFYNGKWEKYTMLLIEWDNGILFTLYSRINLDKGYQSQFNEPVLYIRILQLIVTALMLWMGQRRHVTVWKTKSLFNEFKWLQSFLSAKWKCISFRCHCFFHISGINHWNILNLTINFPWPFIWPLMCLVVSRLCSFPSKSINYID